MKKIIKFHGVIILSLISANVTTSSVANDSTQHSSGYLGSIKDQAENAFNATTTFIANQAPKVADALGSANTVVGIPLLSFAKSLATKKILLGTGLAGVAGLACYLGYRTFRWYRGNPSSQHDVENPAEEQEPKNRSWFSRTCGIIRDHYGKVIAGTAALASVATLAYAKPWKSTNLINSIAGSTAGKAKALAIAATQKIRSLAGKVPLKATALATAGLATVGGVAYAARELANCPVDQKKERRRRRKRQHRLPHHPAKVLSKDETIRELQKLEKALENAINEILKTPTAEDATKSFIQNNFRQNSRQFMNTVDRYSEENHWKRTVFASLKEPFELYDAAFKAASAWRKNGDAQKQKEMNTLLMRCKASLEKIHAAHLQQEKEMAP